MQHGKDWKIVEDIVKTRTGSQVRSHAQKFFIKLTKIAKERKKCKNKDLIDPSEIEKEIMDKFSESDITTNTPQEVAAVIRKDWEAVRQSYSDKKKHQKQSRNKTKKQSFQSEPEDPEE